MGLFTDPLTINDGSADRIYNYRAQLVEPGSIVGEYIEPAAISAADSVLVVKHSTAKNGRKRHLLQVSNALTINNTDGTLEPLIVNITISRNDGHTDEQVTKLVKLATAAINIAGTVSGILRERI